MSAAPLAVCVRIIINWTVSRSHPLCSPTREMLSQQNNGEIVGGGQETCKNIRKVTFKMFGSPAINGVRLKTCLGLTEQVDDMQCEGMGQ